MSMCLNAKAGKRYDGESETFVAHTLRGEGFDASEDGAGRGTPLVPVAFAQNQRDEVRNLNDVAGALAAEPGMKQQTYVAYRASSNGGVTEQGDKTAALTTSTDPTANIVAYQCHGSNVGPMGVLRAGNGNEAGGVPFIINEKGRPEGRTLEYRDDGTVNALLTPSGGRAGIGVGAIAGPRSGVRRLTPVECERLQGFPDDYTRYTADGTEFADGPRYRMLGNAVCVNVSQWIGRRIVAAT